MIAKPSPIDSRVIPLNSSIKVPRERYTCRFIKEEFGLSNSSGNKMITLTAEVIACGDGAEEFVNPADGSKVNISGVECQPFYLPLEGREPGEKEPDAAKSQKAIDRFFDTVKKLEIEGVTPEDGVDIDNPPKVFKGIVFDAILDSEEFVQRKDPTPEQRSKKQPGDPIKDSNGKELKGYSRPKIQSILGRSNVDVSNRAF